ncbi:hypothetical protein [Methanosphaerula subterraneus]|uniref:hypothetical protein n=1 Tax=Methanosphaerula subterraneus TaxID=3350244 RepID=UPI003F872C3D
MSQFPFYTPVRINLWIGGSTVNFDHFHFPKKLPDSRKKGADLVLDDEPDLQKFDAEGAKPNRCIKIWPAHLKVTVGSPRMDPGTSGRRRLSDGADGEVEVYELVRQVVS